ncbi:MAG: aryl-sulfate sulfotransferase, partial [Pricia sp.]
TSYIGDESGVGIDIELNPFDTAPLAAVSTVETPIDGTVEIRIVGQDGEFSDMRSSSSEVSKTHEFDVLGLYAGYENTVEFILKSPDGKERLTIARTIETDPLPEGLPEFEIVEQLATDEQNTVFLVNFRPTNLPLMVDRFGKVRWYSSNFAEGNNYGLQRFANGNMGLGKGEDGQGSIFEYTITGELVKEFSFYPEYENVHHDIYEMENGNFIVPVNKTGAETIEDYIIAMDRNSGDIINTWDLNPILPKRDTLLNTPEDWVHVNAVIHDERDNSIIVSGQRQALFKITWDNQLKWIMAPPFDWDGFEDYLLTSDDPDMEWNWGQHAPLITPEGNLFFFDNGYGRQFGTGDKFSRAVEVRIEEAEIGGTVETVWEYGRERGEAFYSPIISDVDYITSSDTRLIVAGSLAFDHVYVDKDNVTNTWTDEFLKSTILEVDFDKNVLFEMNVNSNVSQGSVYRAEKIKLY